VYKTPFRPRRIDPPQTRIDLPETFAAVRFYDGGGTGRKREGVVETIARISTQLAEAMPVVSLYPGVELDHRHPEIDTPGAQRLPELPPETNLRDQTAVIARAAVFVGSYGGFSYIAPHVGVPTLTWLAKPAAETGGDGPTHLAMVRRLFASPEFGDYLVLTPELEKHAGLLGTLCRALESRGRA
jgi:hypothetical protein